MAKLLSQTPTEIRETVKRAREAQRKNNRDYAEDLMLDVLAKEPELDEVRQELRDIQLEGKKGKKPDPFSSLKGMGKQMAVKSAIKKTPEKALPLAEELLKIDPINAAFLDTYVEAAEASNNPGAAAITLAAVLKLDRKNDKLLEKLGHLYVRMGASHEARASFERLGELRPGDQIVIKWIKDASAMDTMAKGNWEDKGDFRGKLKSEAESISLEQQNRSQQSLSDLDKLIDTQRRKLAQEPDNLNLYRPLSDSLLKAGHFNEALEVLQRADEKANHADPLIQRGLSDVTIRIYEHNIKILSADGDLEGAQAQRDELQAFLLEDAADKVARYPNDLGFKFDYGELLFARGELDKALAQFQHAQKNPQRRVDALYLMGRCFKAKGQFDIAAGQLEKAAEEIPTMDERKMGVIYELGEVLEAQGDFAKALEYYKQIYSVDIGYRDVSKKIEEGYKRAKSKA